MAHASGTGTGFSGSSIVFGVESGGGVSTGLAAWTGLKSLNLGVAAVRIGDGVLDLEEATGSGVV